MPEISKEDMIKYIKKLQRETKAAKELLLQMLLGDINLEIHADSTIQKVLDYYCFEDTKLELYDEFALFIVCGGFKCPEELIQDAYAENFIKKVKEKYKDSISVLDMEVL